MLGTDRSSFLGAPALGRLLEAARERFERNGGPRGEIRLARLSAAEADALNGLLGPRTPLLIGGEARIALADLDRELRGSRLEFSLEQALTLVGGRLADRPAERAARSRARERAWAEVGAHPAALNPALAPWLAHVRRAHGAADPERAGAVISAMDVLERLPSERIELPRLAAEAVGGDPHALDRTGPVGRLVAAALNTLDGGDPAATLSAERWRALWDGVGVDCDDLSCAALALGLRARRPARGYLAARLGAAASAGRPLVLTLRELRDRPPRLRGPELFVCENPSIISSAASALGARCPPLLCSGGWPNTAVGTIVRLAAESGMSLRISADRDQAGHAIAARLLEAPGAEPWILPGEDAPEAIYEEQRADRLIASLAERAHRRG